MYKDIEITFTHSIKIVILCLTCWTGMKPWCGWLCCTGLFKSKTDALCGIPLADEGQEMSLNFLWALPPISEPEILSARWRFHLSCSQSEGKPLSLLECCEIQYILTLSKNALRLILIFSYTVAIIITEERCYPKWTFTYWMNLPLFDGNLFWYSRS